MKNTQKKEVQLDIVIDVKYMKGKRGKYGCENLGFVVYGVKWLQGRLVTSTEDVLLSNHLIG